MSAAEEGKKQSAIRVYYSYARNERDEPLRLELERLLGTFEQNGLIASWYGGNTPSGSDAPLERLTHLRQAHLILLLISPDFISSHETYDIEMGMAMDRSIRGEAIVIPILLRPVFYKHMPFEQLEMFPDNREPITKWSQPHEAWANIANGLHHVLQELSQRTPSPSPPSFSTAFSSASVPPCDVLLVTAAEVETRAVLTLCQQESGRRFERYPIGEATYYDLHTLGGSRTFLVQTEQGTGGPGGSILTVTDGIQQLSPSAVLLVGIAFGMRPEKQRMGDILISHQLLGYELQRIGQNQSGEPIVRSRGDRPQASPRLLSLARSGIQDWQAPPHVHVGLLLSGEKLVDNYDFRQQLHQMEPEAIGGEMEGAGLYAAAQRKKTDWLVIKAICDWADGNKGYQKQQRQDVAAENAARFVLHLLKTGGVSRKP